MLGDKLEGGLFRKALAGLGQDIILQRREGAGGCADPGVTGGWKPACCDPGLKGRLVQLTRLLSFSHTQSTFAPLRWGLLFFPHVQVWPCRCGRTEQTRARRLVLTAERADVGKAQDLKLGKDAPRAFR